MTQSKKQVKFFQSGTSAVNFANEILAQGGTAQLIPAASWLAPSKVRYSTLVKVKASRRARAHVRRVKRNRR